MDLSLGPELEALQSEAVEVAERWRDPPVEAGDARRFAGGGEDSWIEQRVAIFCGRVLGPYAQLTDPGLGARVARNLCYAPGYTIMGGTTQILRNIIGERVLGLPR